jgi:hypothetical protein
LSGTDGFNSRHPQRVEIEIISFWESQRDSIIQPSVDGPSRTGEERLRWVRVPQKFSNPERVASPFAPI